MIIVWVATVEDKEKIERLIEAHGQSLYSFAFRLTLNRHDADDLFQQTWLKVVDYYDTYQDDNFKGWLFKICSNQYKDNYRKASRQKRVIKDDYPTGEMKAQALENAKSGDDIAAQVENRDIKIIILKNLNGLPETKRLPLYMYYYQAMNYEEIAEALKIPIGTVRSRIFDAKKILKQRMEGELYV